MIQPVKKVRATAAELEAFLDEQTPLLQAAAAAAAESFATRAPLVGTAVAEALVEALLKENADASEAAEARCKVLRSALAKEVCSALAMTPEASELTAGWEFGGLPKPVRVELRGTAGRSMLAGAFVVGRAAECDVQAFGDETVLPVQCVVISLPGGVLVADFWSEGGTHVTWRGGGAAGEPSSPVAAGAGGLADARPPAFVVAHGERAVLRVGDRTTITLGPKAPKASKASKAKRAAAETAVTKRKAAAAPEAGPEVEAEAAKPKAPRLQSASTSFGSLFSEATSSSGGSSGAARSASRQVRSAVVGSS